MIEVAQAADVYHAARLAELNAEIKRLRTNLTGLQTYAETNAAKYEVAANSGDYMAQYFRGKADTYGDMARMACVAYGVVSNTEGVGNDGGN